MSISRAEFDNAKGSPSRERALSEKAHREFFEEGGLVTRKEMDGTTVFLDRRGNRVKIA